jgi:hypothetical protein
MQGVKSPADTKAGVVALRQLRPPPQVDRLALREDDTAPCRPLRIADAAMPFPGAEIPTSGPAIGFGGAEIPISGPATPFAGPEKVIADASTSFRGPGKPIADAAMTFSGTENPIADASMRFSGPKNPIADPAMSFSQAQNARFCPSILLRSQKTGLFRPETLWRCRNLLTARRATHCAGSPLCGGQRRFWKATPACHPFAGRSAMWERIGWGAQAVAFAAAFFR